MPGLLERRIVDRIVRQSISDLDFASCAARSLRDDALLGSEAATDYRVVLDRLEAARSSLRKAATRLRLEV